MAGSDIRRIKVTSGGKTWWKNPIIYKVWDTSQVVFSPDFFHQLYHSFFRWLAPACVDQNIHAAAAFRRSLTANFTKDPPEVSKWLVIKMHGNDRTCHFILLYRLYLLETYPNKACEKLITAFPLWLVFCLSWVNLRMCEASSELQWRETFAWSESQATLKSDRVPTTQPLEITIFFQVVRSARSWDTCKGCLNYTCDF